MQRVAPWLKAVNVVLTPTIANRRKKVDKVIDRAVREAEANSGGTAHGDDQFIDDMRHLLRSFADVADLTPTGWTGIIGDIEGRLENRLRIRKLHAQHPELADTRIDRPIIIIGMPRTGTTLLHRLLAAPEGHRAPLLWELMYTDLGNVPDADKDDYRKRVEKMVDGMQKAMPMFQSIHTMGADKAEECLFLLPHGIGFVVRANPPRYVQWMLERDYTADYQYLKQGLQVLQHGQPRRRWVLKSPAHLWNLDAVLKVFPDAQVVWNHRDPATVLASFCSLSETAMSIHVQKPPLQEIGRLWLGLLATGVDRARAARARRPESTVIDVPFKHLTDEAGTKVPELFARLGVRWGETEQHTLDTALARPGGKSGHTYDLARYGVSEGEVDQVFSDYKQYLNLL